MPKAMHFQLRSDTYRKEVVSNIARGAENIRFLELSVIPANY
jgi:hypothetical protein